MRVYRKPPTILVLPARLGLLLAVFLPSAFTGCADELGPERSPTTRIRGSIRDAGRPLSSGWIEFVPIEGTRGNIRSAPIGKDGTFDADNVPVGSVAIRLASVYGPPIRTPLGPVDLGTFRSYQTPIRREIGAGSESRIDIELIAEAEAYRRRRIELSRMSSDPEG